MTNKKQPSPEKYTATPLQVLAFLFRHVRHYWWFLLFMFVCVVVSQVLNLLGPVFMKKFIDGITQVTPSVQNATALVGTIWWIGALRLGSGLMMRLTGYASAYFVPRITARIESTGLERLLGRSYGFFADEHAGSLVRRISRLGDTYDSVHSSFFWSILPGIASGVAVIIGLLFVYPAASLALGVWIVVIIGINYLITRWKIPTDEERSRAQSDAQGKLADIVTNAITVKSFSAETKEAEDLGRALDGRAKAEFAAWKKSEHGLTLTDFLSSFLNAGLLFIALSFWSKGQMTVGDFVMLQGLVMLLMEQLFFIGFSFRQFVQALTGASEIVGVLNTPLEIKDTARAKRLLAKQGEIVFSQVSFSYAGNKVLSDVDLAIRPKEKVAFVGPSGAGKSTMVKLLLRYYDLPHGSIRVDGQDIAKVTQQSLRDLIALVPQDPTLFHRSIRENIAYGKPEATQEEVEAAAKKAHCHEFIRKLPDGYATLVGERGIKLSGGERQRVAIARAILKNAPILVLDEATSALDSESEHLIQDALKALMENKTVIVIAHRLSTIMDMDHIIVMEGGKVTDQGTHQELTRKVGKYQDLWHIQAGSFHG